MFKNSLDATNSLQSVAEGALNSQLGLQDAAKANAARLGQIEVQGLAKKDQLHEAAADACASRS